MTGKMVHRRIISLEGDDHWVKTTLFNSLPDGIHKFAGKDRAITVFTIEGDPIKSYVDLSKKPEKRFEKEREND